MAIHIPSLKLALQCPLPLLALEKHFFFLALMVCSAFHSGALLIESPHCLVIYSGNTNTVNIFNSLHVSTSYNQLVISAMNVVLDHNIDFW